MGPSDIITSVENIITVFKRRSFDIGVVNTEIKFQKLVKKISVYLEICAAGQHVPRIERAVHTVKDRTRCYWVSLPFERVPKIMIDECLANVVSCINNFPAKDGSSKTINFTGEAKLMESI